MDDATPAAPSSPAQDAAFMSALVTEHFVLQSIAGATIGESGTRSAIYLSTLSSGLVAIGFASSSPTVLAALILTVLPTIFILGCFTIVRLVDTTIENIAAGRRIEMIRRHYALLHPAARSFFRPEGDRAIGTLGVRYSSWSVLFTMASMIGVVNSVLGGAACAIVLSIALRVSTPIATASGVVIGLIVLAATITYERRRMMRLASPF